jgi:type VI protein secretion system component VasK
MLPVPPAPPAPAPKRTWLIVVSLIATLLLLTTGVMTTMYLQQKSAADSANAQVTSLNKQVGDQTTKIDNLNTQLNNSQRDLSDAQAATTEMTNEKTALADCLNAIFAADQAIANSGGVKTSAVNALINTANTKCDAAQKYLSPVRSGH